VNWNTDIAGLQMYPTRWVSKKSYSFIEITSHYLNYTNVGSFLVDPLIEQDIRSDFFLSSMCFLIKDV